MPWLRYSSLSSAGQWGQHELVIVTIIYAGKPCQAWWDMETIHLPTSISGVGKQKKFYGTDEKHKYNKNNRNLGAIRKSLCSKGGHTNRTEGTKWPSRSVTLVITTMCTCRTSINTKWNACSSWYIVIHGCDDASYWRQHRSVVNLLDLLYMPWIVNHWQETVTEHRSTSACSKTSKTQTWWMLPIIWNATYLTQAFESRMILYM